MHSLMSPSKFQAFIILCNLSGLLGSNWLFMIHIENETSVTEMDKRRLSVTSEASFPLSNTL